MCFPYLSDAPLDPDRLAVLAGYQASVGWSGTDRRHKLDADKAYDIPRCRRFLHRRRIKVRIARKGIESSQRLGRHRWVIERTLGWLHRYRRLTIRYERRLDIHQAFLTLGCALICFNYLPSDKGL